MTPGAPGAQDQPERSKASTDKLIEKMRRPVRLLVGNLKHV